jgi:hypothetical protein
MSESTKKTVSKKTTYKAICLLWLLSLCLGGGYLGMTESLKVFLTLLIGIGYGVTAMMLAMIGHNLYPSPPNKQNKFRSF